MLESGPEVKTSDFIFDLLLGCALDTSVAGVVLAGLTKKAIKVLVRSSSVFSKVADKAVKNLTRYVDLAAGEIKKDIKNPDNRDAFNLFAHGTYLRALLKGTPNVQKNLTAAAKAANNARKKLPVSRRMIYLQDSPGVAVISAAQAYASQQKLAITLHHIVFEAAVRSGVLKLKDIQNFLELEVHEDDELGMVDLRNKCKLLFEAIIWSRLYGFTPGLNKIHVKNPWDWKSGTKLDLVDVPEKHLEYFLHRFVDPNTWKPFAQSNTGVSDLNRYFMRIVDTSAMLQDQLYMGSITTTKRLVLKE